MEERIRSKVSVLRKTCLILCSFPPQYSGSTDPFLALLCFLHQSHILKIIARTGYFSLCVNSLHGLTKKGLISVSNLLEFIFPFVILSIRIQLEGLSSRPDIDPRSLESRRGGLEGSSRRVPFGIHRSSPNDELSR